MCKRLSRVAHEALSVMARYEEDACWDAGFDGGEYSGAASGRACDRVINDLAARAGFSYDDVMTAIMILSNS